MLVIISDLHFSDRSTGLPIPASAFGLFQERLRDMAYEASKRSDTTYKPIETLDLVLLGDIFDLIRSTKWTMETKGMPGYARPWSDHDDPAFLEKIDAITQEIIAQNMESFKILQKMAAGTSIRIPAALKRGEPGSQETGSGRKRLPVTVNITYLLGNHDWFYHLKQPQLNQTRQRIVSALGLKNRVDQFPHKPEELPELMNTFHEHGVFGRHGDIYDPTSYDSKFGRDHVTVGDALVVEVFNRIPSLIREKVTTPLPAEVRADLDEIASVRPSVMAPLWIAYSLRRNNVPADVLEQITRIWHQLLGEFLENEWIKKIDSPWPFETVDSIQFILRLLQKVSFSTLEWIAPFLEGVQSRISALRGGSELAFEKEALKESANLAKWARFIVYGHTHEYKMVPLRTAQHGKSQVDQIYLNSGTWHPLHQRGLDDATGFISYKTMSYLAFYKGDERKGRSYETWSGTLDL